MCYVTGEVEQPGSYPCGEGATVLKLVALANGFTGKASKSSVRIVRVVNDKKTVLKDVDLDTTLVFDNDVIVVPESFF
jgi:polysaccharide export outer membrane protein